MSTVRVILRGEVRGLGHRGDIVDVSPGYARNYLMPHGLAMPSTVGAERQAEAMKRSRVVRNARDRDAATEIATALVPKIIAITARASESGHLFGSVTAQDIVDAVAAQTNIELDRKVLRLDEHIKTTGPHTIMARLHADVEFPIQIEVAAE